MAAAGTGKEELTHGFIGRGAVYIHTISLLPSPTSPTPRTHEAVSSIVNGRSVKTTAAGPRKLRLLRTDHPYVHTAKI